MNKNNILDEIVDKKYWTFIDWKFFDSRIKIKKNHIEENKWSIITYLKEFFKKNYKIYNFIVYVFSQSYFDLKLNKYRDDIIKSSNVTLNIWSWNWKISENIINLDIINYDNVDIISDASKISILDNKIDFIVNELNLEHVYNYKDVILESYRILKNGWKVWYLIPFIEWFHASPYDYNRFTIKSIEKNFYDAWFKDIKIWIYSWPASWFLWILTEFIAILFSFNLKILYEINLIILMLLLWPIKFLDIFLNKFRNSENIAWVFYLIAKK